MRIRAGGGSELTRFPWQQLYGEGAEGKLFRYQGPLRGPGLDVRLLAQRWELEPAFLANTGDSIQLLRTGQRWMVLTHDLETDQGGPQR